MLISTGTSKQVLIYTWAEKRGAVFARLHCVGERSRVPLGIDCQPCTERGMRSIAARPTGTIGVSGRAGWPTCKPIWIGPPCGGTARSGAPKPKEVESDLDRRRRVAARYDKYAQPCLGLLYLAATWIWLKSQPKSVPTRIPCL